MTSLCCTKPLVARPRRAAGYAKWSGGPRPNFEFWQIWSLQFILGHSEHKIYVLNIIEDFGTTGMKHDYFILISTEPKSKMDRIYNTHTNANANKK